jgi:hypothetical protein
VDTPDVRSYIFTPKFYHTEYLQSPRGYIIVPNVDRIRTAVRDAFSADPAIAARREQLAEEAGTVYVLNGSGVTGQASRIADYLEFLGMSASAPGRKPDVSGLASDDLRVTTGRSRRSR